MPSLLSTTAVTAIASWLRSRAPTRESFIIAGCLALVFGASFLAAFYIRSELLLQAADAKTIVRTITWVVLCKLAIFYARGICHRPLRAIRFEDLSLLVRATTTALLVFVAVNFYMPKVFPGYIPIPRTVILLDWAFTLLAVGGLQATARSLYEEIMPGNSLGQRRTALVIDASAEGREIAERVSWRGGGEYIVSGLLDDDLDHYGTRVAGTRVIGAVDSAADCARRLRVSDVIVRRGSLFGSRLLSLFELCSAMRVRVGIAELLTDDGRSDVHVRSVEVNDLLSHPEARIGPHEKQVGEWIGGRTVLVSGAGGTIGAEVCRQMIGFRPARIVLFDRSEHALVRAGAELRAAHASRRGAEAAPAIDLALGDVGNPDRVAEVLRQHRPEIVIHTAAYGNLAILQNHAVEAVENNVLATATFAELAARQGVRSFVALSSEKAVDPVSVSGASRLLAELFLRAFGRESEIRVVVVRIGEIIDARSGFVAALVRDLRARRPVDAGSAEVFRHFLTLRETASSVLLAGALAESSATFVVDAGPPMSVAAIIESLAALHRIPADELTIHHSGIPDGERRCDVATFDDERRQPVAGTALVRVDRATPSLVSVRESLDALRALIRDGQRERVPAALRSIAARDAAVGAAAGREGVATEDVA